MNAAAGAFFIGAAELTWPVLAPPPQGGYYAWFRVFDNNLRRRRTGEYAEQYTHDGDSCGIHSSGAGFERVDTVEQWVPPSY
jgi:hypothetical protein